MYQFSKKELISAPVPEKRTGQCSSFFFRTGFSDQFPKKKRLLDPVPKKRTGQRNQFSEKNWFKELGTVTGLINTKKNTKIYFNKIPSLNIFYNK